MATIAHNILAGTEVHEPKGIAAATSGQVYVANGAGSGSWNDISTSSFTGMIADFVAPVAPTGWLECDGSDINTTTYASLYGVMTIPTTGTRTSGQVTITSIPSTLNFRVGYYVFGTGITAGSKIATIDSGNQITLDIAASSTGSGSFVVSPWYVANGIIRLPALAGDGYFRRSRSVNNGFEVGRVMVDQNKAHTHTTTGTTGVESAGHTHGFSGSTGGMSANVNHNHGISGRTFAYYVGGGFGNGEGAGPLGAHGPTTDTVNLEHTHSYAGNTTTQSVNHTHNITATSDSNGGIEARPKTVVFLTCVKT